MRRAREGGGWGGRGEEREKPEEKGGRKGRVAWARRGEEIEYVRKKFRSCNEFFHNAETEFLTSKGTSVTSQVAFPGSVWMLKGELQPVHLSAQRVRCEVQGVPRHRRARSALLASLPCE